MRLLGPGEGAPDPGPGGVAVLLTARELSLLSNAVGESLEALEDWELETRLGESRARARQVRAGLKEALAAARRGTAGSAGRTDQGGRDARGRAGTDSDMTPGGG